LVYRHPDPNDNKIKNLSCSIGMGDLAIVFDVILAFIDFIKSILNAR
jgi:hypothetical protein